MSHDNKLGWEVKQIEKNVNKLYDITDKHDERLDVLESFKDTTVEQIKTILRSVASMQNNISWITKFFITSVIGMIITIITTIILRSL